MRRRDRRLILIAAAAAVLAAAMSLTLYGLRDAAVFFVAPSELAEKAEPGRRVRLGGLVVEGSVRHDPQGVVRFAVTDGATQIDVRFTGGVLPDLFREGQGVVAEGSWRPGESFVADRVLAKHDENYMPPEVAEALKARGEWRGAETQPSVASGR